MGGHNGDAVAALLVLLQLADFVTCAIGPDDQHRAEDDLKHNATGGLKMHNKLPHMTKVHISNDEFNRKYLEYFRRLYADESEYEDDNDDVTTTVVYGNDDISATQEQGQVHYYGDDADDDWPTGDFGERDERMSAIVVFPINRTSVFGGVREVAVIKSVARVFVRPLPDSVEDSISVYGCLSNGGVVWCEKPSFVAELTLSTNNDAGGRWMDVDVTRLLVSRKRHDRDDTATVNLLLRHPAGTVVSSEKLTSDCDDTIRSRPVLHVFIDETVREKRDGRGRHHRLSPSGHVRRTDCKPHTSTANNGSNGNEHDDKGNKCCREPMPVAFADLPGYDFIVEPKSFDAGLCRGRCPAKYNMATKHAYIQSLLWRLYHHHNNNGDKSDSRMSGESSENRRQLRRRGRRRIRHGGPQSAAKVPQQPPPKPCCAPNKLERLQILRVDENDPTQLIVTSMKEMIVVECACS